MNKALGLDLGTVTLGIASSDILGFVHGIETFHFKKGEYDKARERVHQIVKETGIKEIALGYPIMMSGEIGIRAEMSEKFKEDLLNEDPTLNIVLVDERLTTVSAHKTINELGYNHEKRKAVVDRMAACEILDFYIKRRERENGN